MKFVVEPRSDLSTIDHPDYLLGSGLDDLEEYLTFDFDHDRVFSLPKNTKVSVSASKLRRSYFVHPQGNRRGWIVLNLQPAVDVAGLVSHYWRSQIWPARVMFDLFAILREICFANGMLNAAEFAIGFSQDRLGSLISASEVGVPEKPSKWFSSRAQMFGGLDERALSTQLATFQTFHEIGHFIGFLRANAAGESFLVETDQDELNCDDFACGELHIAYCERLGVEFLESVRSSLFLSILIWTLAEYLPRLEDTELRACTFAALITRAKAATVRVHRLDHRTEPPSARLEMDALRHLTVFDEMLRIIDAFFVEGLAKDAEMFYYQGPFVELARATPRASLPVQHDIPTTRSAAWESIWVEEDDREARRLDLRKPQ